MPGAFSLELQHETNHLPPSCVSSLAHIFVSVLWHSGRWEISLLSEISGTFYSVWYFSVILSLVSWMQWYESDKSFHGNWMEWGFHRWYEISQTVGECYRHQRVIIPQLQTNIGLSHIASCSTSWVPQYQLSGSAVDFFNAIFISIHRAVQVSSWS